MAHPFRYFRKHQKAFLAVAAVVAMLVFVAGDYFTSMMGQGGGGNRNPNEVIASWKGGRLTQIELDNLSQRRFFISEFLKRLRGTGAARLAEEGGTPMRPPVPDFIIEDGTPARDVKMNVVTTRILADQGKKAGISISDDVINHFLQETSFRRVSDAEIVTLLQGIHGGDQRGLEETLFAGLRELLLGNAYIGSFGSNLQNILPEQRWEDWKRINDRISLEVATLPVSDFVKDVPDPKDAELIAFYEQYKNSEPNIEHSVLGAILPSPNPGFKIPRKVRLNYLLADVNAWSAKYRDTITADEIADYYERNKRTQFVKSGSSASSFDEKLFDESSEKPEGEESSSDVTPANDSDTVAPATGETPAEGSETPAEPSEGKTGATTRRQGFHLTAFQAEPATEGDKPADTHTTAADEPASDEAATDTPADDAADAQSDDKTEYESLEDVKDTIRNKLANDKAVVEINKVMERIQAELQSVYNPFSFDVITARSDKKEIPKPPLKLTDFKKIAVDSGLTSEETVLLSQRELADTFVGKAIDVLTQSKLVLQAEFADLQLYEPFLAKDLDGNLFLVSKVEDTPEKIPTLDEIRGDVVKAWKRREASKLALKKAEEFAAEAQKAGDRLTTFFIGKPYEPLTTDLFSWLTFGTTPSDMQRGPKLGEAPPLEAVGPDFMTKAFELKDSEVGALLNYDQTDAFVFRLDRRENTPEELRTLFLKEANNWYGGQIMSAIRMQNQQRQLLAEITERVGLDVEKLEEYFRPTAEEE